MTSPPFVMNPPDPSARGLTQPLPRARKRRPTSTAVPVRIRVRRRAGRAFLRVVPVVGLLGLTLMGAGWVREGGPLTAGEIAVDIRDDVRREVVARTNDFSASVGPLDCIELHPGRGNCLGTFTSNAHRGDGVMVAVMYTDTGDGRYDLAVRLP